MTTELPIIFVCSPYRSDDPDRFEHYKAYARTVTRMVAHNGNAPITIHRYLPGALDDDDPLERDLAFRIGRRLMLAADEVWVFTDYGISKGMSEELLFATTREIPIRYWSLLALQDMGQGGVEAS